MNWLISDQIKLIINKTKDVLQGYLVNGFLCNKSLIHVIFIIERKDLFVLLKLGFTIGEFQNSFILLDYKELCWTVL